MLLRLRWLSRLLLLLLLASRCLLRMRLLVFLLRLLLLVMHHHVVIGGIHLVHHRHTVGRHTLHSRWSIRSRSIRRIHIHSFVCFRTQFLQVGVHNLHDVLVHLVEFFHFPRLMSRSILTEHTGTQLDIAKQVPELLFLICFVLVLHMIDIFFKRIVNFFDIFIKPSLECCMLIPVVIDRFIGSSVRLDHGVSSRGRSIVWWVGSRW